MEVSITKIKKKTYLILIGIKFIFKIINIFFIKNYKNYFFQNILLLFSNSLYKDNFVK
jgi:hypothetical protein